MPRAKYGSVKRVEDAKRALPPPPSRPDPARIMSAAQAFQAPSLALGAPSARPDEPVTASFTPTPIERGPNPDVLQYARFLPFLETLASQPNATATTRSVVRRMRSMLPPDFQFGDN